MSKRKDNKGRTLQKGETQRKNGLYQYRYTDTMGKRKIVYSKTLKELRDKEKEIEDALAVGIRYAEGNITIIQLLERYISLKKGVRHNTKVGYNFVLNLVKKEPFGNKIIKDIKISDVKAWFIKLYYDDGRGYSTITSIRGVLKPAFRWHMKKIL